jgi:hypothetical protein
MPLKGRPSNPRGRASKISGNHAALFGKRKGAGTKRGSQIVTNRRCINCGEVIPLKTPYQDMGDGQHAHFVCPE